MKERPIIFSTESVKAIIDGRKTQTRRVITPSTSIVGEGEVDWSTFCWDGSEEFNFGDSRYSTESEYVPDEMKGQLIGIKKAPLPLVDGQANEYYPYEHQYLHVPYRWKENATIYRIYPKWKVGDRLWVRETLRRKQNDPSMGADYITYLCDFTPVLNPNPNQHGPVLIRPTWQWKRDTLNSLFMPRWASRILLKITDIRVERLQEISEGDCLREGIRRESIGVGLVSSAGDLRVAFAQLWDSLINNGWEANPWMWVITFKKVVNDLRQEMPKQ